MRRIVSIVSLALVAGTSVASAEIHTHEDARMQVDIPNTWKVHKQKRMLAGESKDQAAGLMFFVVDKTDIAEVLQNIDSVFGDTVKNLACPDKPKPADINGLKGIKNVCTAKIAGKPSFVMFAILGPTPTKKGIVIFGGIEQSKASEHKAELQNIFASLKPIR